MYLRSFAVHLISMGKPKHGASVVQCTVILINAVYV